MDVAALRPIFSGLIGAIVTVWLLKKLRRWIPETCEGRDVAEICKEHRWKVRAANFVGFVALIGGVALYHFGVFSSRDWRGLGLGFGAACVAPTLLLVGTSLVEGRRATKEALVAYAVGQKTPPVVLYSLLGFGWIIFAVTLGSLLGA